MLRCAALSTSTMDAALSAFIRILRGNGHLRAAHLSAGESGCERYGVHLRLPLIPFGQRKINADRLDNETHGPILNQMVYYLKPNLDRTFAALADPTRRALLARLSEEDSLSVSELAKPFSMSLPAVMKHLDVLSDAGLVGREKSGRIVSCRLRAEPMRDANDWLNRYQKFWTDRLDQLAAFLEEETWPPPSQSNPASPSRDALTRRRNKSSRPGRTQKK
jgi:DNA-binding transcriptional ArsR family regulator